MSSITEMTSLDPQLALRLSDLLNIHTFSDGLEEPLPFRLPVGILKRLRGLGFQESELSWIKASSALKNGDYLTREESLRLLQLVRVFCAATAVMGTEKKAWEVLRTPRRDYGGLNLIQMSKSKIGADHVSARIHQLCVTPAELTVSSINNFEQEGVPEQENQ